MIKKFIYALILAGIVINCPHESFAATEYKIQRMTPEVEAALEARRQRYSQLKEMKTQGVLGEDNRGYVAVLIEGDEAFAVAGAENSDRSTIYNTIAEQNNLTDAIETIEKVFAKVKRQKADPGEQYQDEQGNWITK